VLANAPFVGFIPVRGLSEARSFYEGTLGLSVIDANDFAVTLTSASTKVFLVKVDDHAPTSFTIAGWGVEDLASAIDTLREAGVVFRHYEGFGQDEREIWHAPDGDAVAWFADPHENILSLTQFA